MRNINFEVPDDLYFKLVQLKGKYHCNSWLDLFTKLANDVEVEEKS